MERQIRAIWQDGAGRNLSGLYLAAARRAHGESPVATQVQDQAGALDLPPMCAAIPSP